MTLKESVTHHVQLTLKETEDAADALEYIDDIIVDVMEEFPNADEEEVRAMIEKELEE